MKKQRPVNLDLKTIQFPAAAKASILHRVSGVMMIFAVGIMLWTLSLSLSSAEGFAQVQNMLEGFFFKFIYFGIISALSYHFLAGIRHLVMDMGHWEEKASGNLSAKIVIVLWIVLSIVAGVWIW